MPHLSTPEQKVKKTDYRTRLYERYVTIQLKSDLKELRRSLDAGSPYNERLVRKFFPQDHAVSILDLGCGYGSLLHTLKKFGYTNIAGIDASPEQVQVAHQLGLDCVEQGDLMETLPNTPENTHDVIAAFDVLEHFTKDEVLYLFDNINRILKPGGFLILHVPNGEAIFSGKIYFGDFTHQVAFTRQSISQVGACCGFASVDSFEDTPIPHGFKSSVRAVLWKLIRNWFRFVNAVETGDPGTDLILSQNLLAICRKSAKA